MPILNRRQVLQSLSATGMISVLPGCIKSIDYQGEKWWTKGGHAPVQEELDTNDLIVEGEIPRHLSGLYVRNGGNFRGGEAPHYFVGDGMLHGVWLENGSAVRYKNRWVQTTLITDNKKASANKVDNMSNTSVFLYGGRLLSLMEIGFPYEINPDLSTKGVYRFDNSLNTAVTAHPKIHPTSKNLQFYGMDFFSNPFLHYREANLAGEIVKRIDIDLPASSMQHDFQRTENHLIFLDLPIVFDKIKALSGRFPYRWKGDEYGARIGILHNDDQGKDIHWFSINTCFSFHTLNAFEKRDGTIVLQLSRFREIWKRNPYDVNEPSVFYQYHIHPTKGIISEGPLDDRRIDFGLVDQRFSGTEHQHAFFSKLMPTGPEKTDPVRFSGLIHYNQQGITKSDFTYPEHMDCGEWCFVPRSEQAPEGDGHLLGFVYDHRSDTSTLDIFDTHNLAVGPVARIHIPARVPFGFHGTFVPQNLDI